MLGWILQKDGNLCIHTYYSTEKGIATCNKGICFLWLKIKIKHCREHVPFSIISLNWSRSLLQGTTVFSLYRQSQPGALYDFTCLVHIKSTACRTCPWFTEHFVLCILYKEQNVLILLRRKCRPCPTTQNLKEAVKSSLTYEKFTTT